MLWSTGVPLLTSVAPQHSGKITSLIGSGVGLGLAIGPPIGSLIYTIGGYICPFVFGGLMELCLLLIGVFTLPGYDNQLNQSKTESNESYGEISGLMIDSDDRLVYCCSKLREVLNMFQIIYCKVFLCHSVFSNEIRS